MNTSVMPGQPWFYLRFFYFHLGYSTFNVTCIWFKSKRVVLKKKMQLLPCWIATWGIVSKYRFVICWNFLHWGLSQCIPYMHKGTSLGMKLFWFQCVLIKKFCRLRSVEEGFCSWLFRSPFWLLLLQILM